MTVFVLAELKFTDEPAYRRYQAVFGPVFRRFQGRVLAADESPEVLEGAWDRDQVVLMEFPDEAQARAFIDDPEYQAISRDRRAGAETVSLLVRGL